MKILLLGGAGFIGKNLALKLISLGHVVFIFDRVDADYHAFEDIQNIRIIKGDFDNIFVFRDLFQQNAIDIVVHLISSIIPGTELASVISEVDHNLIATMKFLDTMKYYGVKKIIYFSSGGTVYGNNGNRKNKETDVLMPINSYGWMKVVLEKYIQYFSYQNDLKYVILRPSNPYGGFQDIYGKQGLVAVSFGKVLNNRPIEVWGDGTVVRDYIFIDDLCCIVSEIIQNDHWNEIYNIGSGKGYSINQILSVIRRVSGRDIEIIYKEKRNIDAERNVLNIDKIRNVLAVNCSTHLEDGILLTWEWINKNY